ncbi:MAG TPA: hypothetical protein PKX48_08120 [Planctomycetota bacterium]|jgi:hypothetical protein|nr:MAG: hypothetical protein BWX69_01127 [Planctomycetes bacterium ADurb.Bin069]HNR99770.1 hypothetical protein [Planctomycetota bacterium]HNU27215.1 hypothetical protein [Planctomycetota bacterium]HOE29829.1 hypothetical protein [Planctomycetota bacterium]HOE86932.1 hypothetical protein [Planctomycetota bacterium]
MSYGLASLCLICALAAGCAQSPGRILFKDDFEFLKAHTKVVVLTNRDGNARVAVNPDLQGRVMTSTAAGPDGQSFGWINRELIASGKNDLHFNAFGGEDRFWLGPEGGQFSIFFKQGDPFDMAHWFTPPPINEGPYEIVAQDAGRMAFRKTMHLVNYSGTAFDLELHREVRVLETGAVAALGLPTPAGVATVAYCSDNRITNKGAAPWRKETGLLSIWILGMFNPSPATTIVIPFAPGPESELGPPVNDAYFGKVPADRLIVKDGVLFFSADGKHRSKIGLSPRRAKPFAGSYDAANGVLTIVHLTIPEGKADYVNSMWEIQKDPYAGDVINSYNDGPTPTGKPLGPFYEIESSSPGAALAPGATLAHVHTTMHFQGSEEALDPIARKALGVGIETIKGALAAR